MADYLSIAQAFVSGCRVPAPSRTSDGRARLYAGALDDGRPALFSYGPHFPAVIRDEANDRWLLNNEDYQPTDGERGAAGWTASMYSNRARMKYSPATRNQLANARQALTRAGLVDTGVREFGPRGHEYAIFMRPDSPYLK